MWTKWKKFVSKRVCIISPVDPSDEEGRCRGRLENKEGGGSGGGGGEEDESLRSRNNRGESSDRAVRGRGGRKPVFSRSNTEPIMAENEAVDHVHRNQTGTSATLSFSGPIASSSNEGKSSGVRISRTTCSICLETMKPGCGQALFTAECSHTFHFSCIVSNVRYGNQICPVCRAKWKDVPWQAGVDTSRWQRSRSSSHRRAPSAFPYLMSDMRSVDPANGREEGQRRTNQSFQLFDESALSYPGEPDVYNDDEPLNIDDSSSPDAHLLSTSTDASTSTSTGNSTKDSHDGNMSMKAYTEVSAVLASESRENFMILIHLKAPPARATGAIPKDDGNPSRSSRAPIDLVAVLDVSGSMAGRKLGLLKQAMAFVVRNLSSADRLSVVVFSSTAKRIFPLRKMSEEGQSQSLQAMDGLIATGGTNIAEGLRKGVKVLEDRKDRNPVASIMLLSDGQDTYSMSSRRQLPLLSTLGARGALPDLRRLVPRSIRNHNNSNNNSSSAAGQAQIPVHTFGFGSDHDAATMHSIAEVSGGTFSFIQAEEAVQDAFAQCIGGLLSVVAQDVQLTMSCLAEGVRINGIHAGSYESSISDTARNGVVKLGDLYAEEERDVLVDVVLPAWIPGGMSTMPLMRAECVYKDTITQEMSEGVADEVRLKRLSASEAEQEEAAVVSLQVDRQRNRLRAAQAIAEARALADEGNIEAAHSGLQGARAMLESSLSAMAGDHLCNVLDSELSAIQERMASRHMYERSGRAYLLSAQSSHLRQRATTRGDSVDGLIHDYQTPSMVDMVTLSQTRAPLLGPSSSSNNNNNNNNNAAAASSSSGSDADASSGAAASSRTHSFLRRASAKVLRSHHRHV